jgi:hypothetical protein
LGKPGCQGGRLIGVHDDDPVAERTGCRRRIIQVLLLIAAVTSLVANIIQMHDRQKQDQQRAYQQCLERYRYPGMNDSPVAQEVCKSPFMQDP